MAANALRKLHSSLDLLDPEIADDLYAQSLITSRDKQKIDSEHTSIKKASTILTLLARRNPERALQGLIQSLEKNKEENEEFLKKISEVYPDYKFTLGHETDSSVKVQAGRKRKHESDDQKVHKKDKHVQKKTKRTSRKAAVKDSSDSSSSPSSSSRESLEREDSDSVLAHRLTKPCTDLHLSRIAHSMTEWESIAIYFGIEQSEVQTIKRNYSMSFNDQKYQMLLKWKENLGKAATYKKLIKVFQDLKNQQMVDSIKDIVLE